jgi:ATPase
MKKKYQGSLVLDSSILVSGFISKNKDLFGEIESINIDNYLFSYFEKLSKDERSLGLLAINEIKNIVDIFKEKVNFVSKMPSIYDINNMDIWHINSVMVDFASSTNSSIITHDKGLKRVAEARGIEVIFIEEKVSTKTSLDKFFDETTMSVHLKENVKPVGKKGKPGEWEFVELREEKLTQDELKQISEEIIGEARARNDSFVEIEREGSTIVQLGSYRIVITRPPFSDGWEITAVHPVRRLELDEYKLDEKLVDRIKKEAEGILIAGAPGMGKSTFCQGLGDFYAAQKKIIKTVEAPRDLIFGDEVTQYAISHGSPEEIHDILLLSRPDYTIFDEMRNTDDFKLFADMRLSGVGMIGVMHATNPIDAIQRFLGRIELGVIPQIIDTVFFIKNGVVDKVLSLNMTVKVPEGMTEQDLARPIVEVKDYLTGKPEFEIYSYGEETVVIPLSKVNVAGTTPVGSLNLAEQKLKEELKSYGVIDVSFKDNHNADVYVKNKDIPRLIGKSGRNISLLEDKYQVHLNVNEYVSKKKEEKTSIPFKFLENNKSILLVTNKPEENVDVYEGGNFLFSATTSKKGEIKIKARSKLGNTIQSILDKGEKIEIFIGE